MTLLENSTDLIVFSAHHSGSEEVRTTELMRQFAMDRRVFFFEAPIMGVSDHPTYLLKEHDHEITLIQPYLPANLSIFEQKQQLREILKQFIDDEHVSYYTVWADSPKAMTYIRHLSPEFIIYDQVRDFSLSHPELESEILQYADVVLPFGSTEILEVHEVRQEYVQESALFI